ncbi:hypothetical protein RHMOL_Rhmol04G0099900 [Rhododendron molle]|uniref:Uncharacterized protein n=1 Tax=Rhododendron molle TaxID=49168 RepID=A0ACC0NZY3_RHOML|nr:hypothetical protein RHMOL_Rhmol04G0099900 [Rhododendron molle]
MAPNRPLPIVMASVQLLAGPVNRTLRAFEVYESSADSSEESFTGCRTRTHSPSSLDSRSWEVLPRRSAPANTSERESCSRSENF